ncbi:MAG: methionine gamma-lyase [Bacteroidetes bacterium GWF2_38_335]|nr:MAG: methionine gamma-lyase [Bacteroidetes bacterium GWF2_38_335]OFY78458.1 MAG: methionine gamma-lyase [Bacteroidetes bacterium RIFOXYA12_FULL_38_20]HBS88404.1 methionine gamma-lyase [Bacteroidales bacterium]
MENKDLGFNSKLIHAGDFHDELGSAVTPIYQTSTFRFRDAQHGANCFAGKDKGYIYTRIGNPTIDALENKLAALENGYRGIVLSSGMAAVTAVYMTLLDKHAHVVSTDAVYGPSRAVLNSHFEKFGVKSTFIDTSKIENIENSINLSTKLIYIETPTNPTIQLTDLKKVVEVAKKNGIITCVDNTFCSPYLQNPLDFGIDIVVHSMTKFINGHADIVGGAIIAKDPDLYAQLRKTMVYMGGNMDPHQAYMVSRGLKTLALRMERSEQNAMKVAEHLEKHPKISWIKYPGLKSYPQYELAKTQMKGFGSMISFGVKGDVNAGATLMNSVKLATLAVSLGGVETLIQHPASMTHAGVSKEQKLAAGITDDLVRFSVGIEDVEDIIADLDQALANV